MRKIKDILIFIFVLLPIKVVFFNDDMYGYDGPDTDVPSADEMNINPQKL